MLRFHTFIVFSCLLYGLVISDEAKKEKVQYYPRTASTAASSTEDQLKSSAKAQMYMEGQYPTSIKSNSATSNLIKIEEKKEGRTVGRKGAFYPVNTNDTLPDAHKETHMELGLNKTVLQTNLTTVQVTPKPNTTIQHKVTNTTHAPSTSVKPTSQRIVPVKEDVQEAKVTEVKEMISEVVTQKTTKKTPKPKPLITSAGKESDAQANEPIPALPTSKSPLGMPRKIDYIVPVVITITALPLLGVAFYVLYKRGRDYWDKRHYRRMDFLIDGMYNE